MPFFSEDDTNLSYELSWPNVLMASEKNKIVVVVVRKVRSLAKGSKGMHHPFVGPLSLHDDLPLN